jgi:hypothetical protein
MIIEIVEGCYIHVKADNGMELVNYDEVPEIRTKEIYVPLNGDYSMWIQEPELIDLNE